MLVTHVAALDTEYFFNHQTVFCRPDNILASYMAGGQKLQAPGCHGESVCMMAPNICGAIVWT